MCCNFGEGGPIEVYDGPVSDDRLLFSHRFEETGRLLESFVLVGTGPSSSAQLWSLKTATTAVLVGSMVWALL